MERMLVALGSMALILVLATVGAGRAKAEHVPAPTPGSQSPGAPRQRLLVAVPAADALTEPAWLARLATRLHVADPAATPLVMLPGDPARAIGPFVITIEPLATSSDSLATVRIRSGGGDAVQTPVRPATGGQPSSTLVTVIEVLGDVTGIVAHRMGLLELTPDELRLPAWQLPGHGADAVALDGAWWTLGPSAPLQGPSPPPQSTVYAPGSHSTRCQPCAA